jgi:hypothetical protein
MSVFERLRRAARAEWQALSRHEPPAGTTSPSTPPRARDRVPAASDVQGALRVLELSGTPSLQQVRAQYALLARRYHPRTLDDDHDDAHAARVVVDALTEALELLEEHLLPLPALTGDCTNESDDGGGPQESVRRHGPAR